MDEEVKTKRTRKPAKSKDERVAAIDAKIEKKKQELAKLEEAKEKLLHPVSMRDVLSKAKEAGFDPREIAEKLGIEL